VNLPAAARIGVMAFGGCTSLTSVTLSATPPAIVAIENAYYGIFARTGTSGTGTITIAVPMGAVPTYASAWGVSAHTPANGKPDRYGENHKAVTITGAAR
jgi:hypothetical protein